MFNHYFQNIFHGLDFGRGLLDGGKGGGVGGYAKMLVRGKIHVARQRLLLPDIELAKPTQSAALKIHTK